MHERDPEQDCEFLRGVERPRTAAVVEFIQSNKGDVAEGRKPVVEPIRTVMQAAPTAYNATRDSVPSRRGSE